MNTTQIEVWTCTSPEGQVTSVGLAFGEGEDDFCEVVETPSDLQEVLREWDAEALRDLCAKMFDAMRMKRVPPNLPGDWEWIVNPYDHAEDEPGFVCRPWHDIWLDNNLWVDVNGRWGHGDADMADGEVELVPGDPAATILRGIEAADAWAKSLHVVEEPHESSSAARKDKKKARKRRQTSKRKNR